MTRKGHVRFRGGCALPAPRVQPSAHERHAKGGNGPLYKERTIPVMSLGLERRTAKARQASKAQPPLDTAEAIRRAVNHRLKSVGREIRPLRSVGAGGG